MKTVQIIVIGEVQGVFYRASAKDAANKLGIKGWIKNSADGSVEVRASGPETLLQQFIQWCAKGPARAKVSKVLIEDLEDEFFDSFIITK